MVVTVNRVAHAWTCSGLNCCKQLNAIIFERFSSFALQCIWKRSDTNAEQTIVHPISTPMKCTIQMYMEFIRNEKMAYFICLLMLIRHFFIATRQTPSFQATKLSHRLVSILFSIQVKTISESTWNGYISGMQQHRSACDVSSGQQSNWLWLNVNQEVAPMDFVNKNIEQISKYGYLLFLATEIVLVEIMEYQKARRHWRTYD